MMIIVLIGMLRNRLTAQIAEVVTVLVGMGGMLGLGLIGFRVVEVVIYVLIVADTADHGHAEAFRLADPIAQRVIGSLREGSTVQDHRHGGLRRPVVGQSHGGVADRGLQNGELHHGRAHTAPALHGGDPGNGGAGIHVIHVGHQVVLTLRQTLVGEGHGGGLGRTVVYVGGLGQVQRGAHAAQIRGLQLGHGRVAVQGHGHDAHGAGVTRQHAVIGHRRGGGHHRGLPEHAGRGHGVLVEEHVIVSRLKGHHQLLCLGGALQLSHLFTVQKNDQLQLGVAHEMVGQGASEGHALVPHRIHGHHPNILVGQRVIDGNQHAEAALLIGIGRDRLAVIGVGDQLGPCLGLAGYLHEVALVEAAALRRRDQNGGCLGIHRELIHRAKAVAPLADTHDLQGIHAVGKARQRNIAAVPVHGLTAAENVLAGGKAVHAADLDGHVAAADGIDLDDGAAHGGLHGIFNAEDGMDLHGGLHHHGLGDHDGREETGAVLHGFIGLQGHHVGAPLLQAAVRHGAGVGIGALVATAQQHGAAQALGPLLLRQLQKHVAVRGGDRIAVGIQLQHGGHVAVVVRTLDHQIHIQGVVTTKACLGGGEGRGLQGIDVGHIRLDEGAGDLILTLGIHHGTHGLELVAAAGEVLRIGERDLHGVSRDGGDVHGGQLIDGAVFVLGVDGQSRQSGKILARQGHGGAVLALSQGIEIHQALHAVERQLGGHGGGDLHRLTEHGAVGKGNADGGGLGVFVVGQNGVGVQVGRVVGIVISVVPLEAVSILTHGHADAVLQILGRQRVLGGVGHGQERVLIGIGGQCEPMQHPIGIGHDHGLVNGQGRGQHPHVVGHGHVQGLSRLGIGIDLGSAGVGGRQLHGGQLGLLTRLDVHVAAPVVDDGNADADDLDTAPGLLQIQAQGSASQLGAADQKDFIGDLDGHAGVGLEEGDLIGIVIVGQGNGALAHQHVENVHPNAEGQLQVGIPVYLTADGIQDVDTRDADVRQRGGNTVQGEGHLGLCLQHVEDGELADEGQGQGRELIRDEEALIHPINARARAADPEDAHGVNGDAGLDAAHAEVDLIGNGEAVVALELELGLHFKDHHVRGAVHAELPVVVDDLEGQAALDVGHAVHVGGNAHLNGGVEADEATLAEQNVVHIQVQGAHLAVSPRSLLPLVLGVGGAKLGGGVVAVAQFTEVFLHGGVADRRAHGAVGHQEVGGELGAEGDDTGIAVSLLHNGHLAVTEVQGQAHQGLGDIGGTGPDEGNDLTELLIGEIAQLTLLGVHGDGVKLPFLDGGQGADAAPHLGVGARGAHVTVDVHGDVGLIAAVTEIDGDGHATVADVEGLVDLNDLALHEGQGLGLEHAPLLGGEHVEVAAHDQHDVLLLGGGILVGLLGIVADQLVMVGGGGAVAPSLHRDQTVDARADEAGIPGLRHVGHVEAQGIADDVLHAGIVPIDDDLPGALAQGLIQHQGGGVAIGVNDHQILVQHHVVAAVHGTEDDAILALVAEQAEIGARQIHEAAARLKHGIGAHARKSDLGVVRGGAEHVQVVGEQHVLLGQLALTADVVDHDLDLAVVGYVGGIDLEVKADVVGFPCLEIRHGLGKGVLQVGTGDDAAAVVRVHLLSGVHGHGHAGEIRVSRVLQLDGHGIVAGQIAVEILVAFLILGEDHAARGDVVHGNTSVGGLVVGIYAVIKSHALAISGGGHATHGIVQGHGAVCGHELKVVGIGIVKGIGGRGLVIEHAGGQVVPMGEGDLRGNDDLSCHGGVQGVRRDRGCGLAVVGEEIVVVIGAAHGGFLLHRGVGAVAVAQHVDGVILQTQGGIHHHAGIHVLHGHPRKIRYLVRNVRHTVLVGVGAHEGDGLGKPQTIHHPRRLNGVVRGLGHADLLAGKAEVAVIPTEHVVSRHPVAGHAEGGEGGIKGAVGVQKVFVVVGFGELVALLGAHVEAAVGLRHLHLHVSVADLQITGIVYNFGDRLHRGLGAVSQSMDRQSRKQHGCHHQHRDHLHSYTLHHCKTSRLSDIVI